MVVSPRPIFVLVPRVVVGILAIFPMVLGEIMKIPTEFDAGCGINFTDLGTFLRFVRTQIDARK